MPDFSQFGGNQILILNLSKTFEWKKIEKVNVKTEISIKQFTTVLNFSKFGKHQI